MPKAMRGMEGRAKTTSVTLAPEPGPGARLPVHDLILTCGKTDAWMDACMDAQMAAWTAACTRGGRAGLRLFPWPCSWPPGLACLHAP